MNCIFVYRRPVRTRHNTKGKWLQKDSKHGWAKNKHYCKRQTVLFPGRCSVTIFLTDLDGTVTRHDGNFLAVDGFPFFDGNVLALDGKSNFDGIFTAVTQHDCKVLAVARFSFLDGKFLAVDGKSNFYGIFTAVTQHDGKLPAADGFRFLGAASKWPYAKHISST